MPDRDGIIFIFKQVNKEFVYYFLQFSILL